MKTKTKSKKWSPQEKLKAVSANLSASEGEIGSYLRREGLHSQQLNEWQSQALSALGPTVERADLKEARERIKELEREVRRKDKALAEASALLILQKKINLIWGDEDPK